MPDQAPTFPIPTCEPGRPPHRGSAPDAAPTTVVTVHQRPDLIVVLTTMRGGKGRHIAPKRGLLRRAVSS